MTRHGAAATLLAVAAQGVAVAGPVRWTGIYAYDLTYGRRSPDGAREWAEYRLALPPASCLFTAREAHREQVIRCTATPKDNALEIRFLSYGNGKLVDERGNPEYTPGDPLFTLEAVGERVLTHWKGFPLPDEKPHPPGVYFRPGHPAP